MVITMKVDLGYLYSQLYLHCSPKASSFSKGTRPLRSNSVKILVSGSVSSFELKTLLPAHKASENITLYNINIAKHE